MIKLQNITKDYKVADTKVRALKGVSLSFRKSEFVSILGPSGCGKTTLLNIIGGLDHYTSGDLIIDNISTKEYKDRDWDTYRNHRVGFVFQSYNLIPHQTVLENVELALNIAGFKKDERIRRAKKALDRVGLKGEYNKKPNQLSGGQCQRVAIARALVNDPEILLADEPTGALDTETSKQIMDLIKEISNETLVIMVTHNPELAELYSTRIIRLLDGKILSDSNEFIEEEEQEIIIKKKKSKKSKLGFWSAFKLSFRNLWSKFKRTILVCMAGSIGVIGVASVLSVSTGIQNYIDNMQNDMLSGNPITIEETTFNVSAFMEDMSMTTQKEIVKNNIEDGFINVEKVVDELVEMADKTENLLVQNEINKDYIAYLMAMPKEYISAYTLDYGIELSNNLYTNSPFTNQQDKEISLTAIKEIYTAILKQTKVSEYASMITGLENVFLQLPSNNEFVLDQYDIISSDDTYYPNKPNEITIVINKDTELSDLVLAQLGFYSQEEFLNVVYKATEDERYDENLDKDKFSYESLLGRKFTWYPNNEIFNKTPDTNPLATMNPFSYNPYVTSDFENGVELTITSILRPKADLSYGCLQTGIYYTSSLIDMVLDNSLESEIVNYMKTNNVESFNSGEVMVGNQITQMGIKYNYSFEFDGTSYENFTGYIGKQNMMASMMGSMMGNSNIPNYYTLKIGNLGGSDLPIKISLYPVDFEIKDQMTAYLDKWNSKEDIVVGDKTLKSSDRPEIQYTDALGLVISMISSMVSMVTTALVVFTALSLVVSTVMIAIITYVSVIERIKEIGVIRSLGGRKRDVSRLFVAESGIIGLISGILGVTITWIITLIINAVAGITIATMTLGIIMSMISVSVGLTLISGLIPANLASKKDPVVALRSE